MEQVKLYCRGSCCGRAELREEAGRLEIRAQMPDPGDGLYRAVLTGERGSYPLGVMEPKDGMLVLRRRPALCDIARIGAVRSVQAGCSYLFRKSGGWTVTDCPAELFRSEWLRSRMAEQRHARWRREAGRLALALVLKTDAPFPLEALFCFARTERIGEELCAVFLFDENEMPVQAGRQEKTDFS